MSVKLFKVYPCDRSDISSFIEEHHYSHNVNGCIADYCFMLVRAGIIIGAMFYGRMAMAGQYKKYSDKEEDVIELRRLVCIDNTPKNTESYFIGNSLRWLRKNTSHKIVVSYSDLEHGHLGIVYRASNFEFKGFLKGARVIVYEGKQYHDKTIRTKYKGGLKPFAIRIKQALENGEAYYKPTAGKNAYVYQLKK